MIIPTKKGMGTRRYGYSLRDTDTGKVFGWYRYKTDAVGRANELEVSRRTR